MCYKPLTIDIKHRQRYFNGVEKISNNTVTVPCGHCEHCMATIRNDIYLRMLEEFKQSQLQQGKALFLTFTYSEYNIPRYEYFIENEELIINPIKTIPSHNRWFFGFNLNHLQNYFKTIRKTLERELGFGNNCIRYFVTTEYGDHPDHTQRAHYHAIVFLSKPVCDYFRNNPFTIKDFFQKYWKKGIISESLKHGLFVTNDKAIRYVTKYICKNNKLLDNKHFQRFYNFISRYARTGTELIPKYYFRVPYDAFNGTIQKLNTDKLFNYYAKKYKFGLTYIKSIYFGKTMLNDIVKPTYPETYDAIQNGIQLPLYGKLKQYQIPKYILDHIIHNYREDGSYYLNDFGRYYRSRQIIDNAENFIKSIYKFDIQTIKHLQLPNAEEIYNEIIKIKSSKTYQLQLCVYRTLVRNKLIPVEYYDTLYNAVTTCASIDDIRLNLDKLLPSEHLQTSEVNDLAYYFTDYIKENSKNLTMLTISEYEKSLYLWESIQNIISENNTNYYKSLNDKTLANKQSILRKEYSY